MAKKSTYQCRGDVIDVIRYKLYNYQEVPTHTIKKTDIVFITYQNGEVAVFEQSQQESKVQSGKKKTDEKPKGKHGYKKNAFEFDLSFNNPTKVWEPGFNIGLGWLHTVRRIERKENEMLKNYRYTILRKYKNLSFEKKCELDALLLLYPKLGEAYRLRQLFLDVFEIKDPDEAKGFLWFWCEEALDAGIEPLRKFVNTVKSHWSGVVAYFDKKVTNGVLEGINSKIQLTKRKAKGYRNTENFINMIYFLSAKLKPKYYPYKTL